MQVIETLALSCLLFAFFVIFYLPLGSQIVALLAPKTSGETRLLFSLAASSVFYELLMSVFVLLGLPNSYIRLIFLSLIILVLVRVDLSKIFQGFGGIWQGVVICFIYFLLLNLTASFPIGDFRDVLPSSINHLTGYPIDNLIPYNVSRYFVERIDPRVTEVVPTWAFSDRGPLAGILHAAVCVALGVSEKAHWLGASSGVYFIFQSHLVFLNISAFFAFWVFIKKRFSKKAAGYALILLGTTSFMFLNTLFTWPKLFMCYFVVLIFEILSTILFKDCDKQNQKHYSLAIGSLFALGTLAHDMMLFYLVAFFIYIAARTLKNRSYFKILLYAGTSFAITYLPWQIYKSFFSLSKSRLIYLHLFCVEQRALEGKSFFNLLSSHIETNGIDGMMTARIKNFVYPFDFSQITSLVSLDNFGVYRVLRSFASLAPYQLVFSLGLPVFILSLVGIWKLRSDENAKGSIHFIIICLLSLIPTAFLFSCSQPVNHTWVYPLMMFLVLPAAVFLSKGWHWLFLPIVLSWNLIVLVFELWFRNESSIYLSSDPTFLIIQGVLCLLFISSGFLATDE